MMVNWTTVAANELTAIHNYIAQHSPRYAQKVIDRIIQRAKPLAQFPLLGAVVPEYNDASIREMLEPPYRIIYRVLPQRIDVVAVVHGARQLPSTPP